MKNSVLKFLKVDFFYIMGTALVFGCFFWVVDGIIEFAYFRDNLHFLIVQGPQSYLESIILKVSPHGKFVRTSFLVASLLGGLLVLLFLSMRKATEKALKESEEKYRILVETAPYGIQFSDTAGKILFSNRAHHRIQGYADGELIGRYIWDLVAEDNLKRKTKKYYRRLTLNKPPPEPYFSKDLTKDGRVIHTQINWDYVHNAQGELTGIISIISDITEHKRATEAARLLEKELAHLDRVTMMGELMASMAHEINQPLTAILSNAQAAQRFLERDPPNLEEIRDILADIVSEDIRAGDVIRKLRSLYSKGELNLESIDINDVIREVITIVKSETIIRGVLIEAKLDPGLPVVCGDWIHLQQVMLNSILNASNAMADKDPGSRKIVIATTHQGKTKVKVSVRDHGFGIAENNLGRIFDPFYTTRQDGMGMGLSINRSIIEAHGGRLWAENNPDQGATFHFTLPVDKE